jgi:hypothetical protein
MALSNAQWGNLYESGSDDKLVHPLKVTSSQDSQDSNANSTLNTSSHFLAALNDAQGIKRSPPHRRSKSTIDNLQTISDINVGGRAIPAEDLLKLANPDLAVSISNEIFRPLSFPRRVYQNNFIRGRGNALQAAVASIFGLTLLDVPNFIEMPEGYAVLITKFYQQRSGGVGKCVKIMLRDTETSKESACKDHTVLGNGAALDSSFEMTYTRSHEECERVASIKENCFNNLSSVLNDKRMTIGQLEGFNRQLNELVQGALLALSNIPRNPQHYDIPDDYNNKICILRGKSPRGDFGHVVVAKHLSGGKFEMLHDPYPDGNFLDASEGYAWCLFFV